MAKFSFHCQCYKKENINGIDRHNRRKNKHYGNQDIDTACSKFNRVFITPDTTLYQACKKQIEERVLSHGSRVTRSSNWLAECIFSYPEELPADRADEYFTLVIEYMQNKLGKDNVIQAISHADEAYSRGTGLQHLHLDVIPITADYRLSSKSLINRDFILSVHNELPKYLQRHGFNVERGSAEHEAAGLSTKEYKKAMDKEASLIDQRLNALSDEYNRLAEAYNALVIQKKHLEQRNMKLAYDLINHRPISR